MENQDDDDGVFLHSFRKVPSTGRSRDESAGPEAGQGEPEPPTTKLASIEFRIQQLHNRRFLLQKMRRRTRREEQLRSGSTKELIPDEEDEDDDDELRRIQKELEELQTMKEELEGSGVSFTGSCTAGQEQQHASYKQTPRGGFYMLPPPPQPAEAAAAAAHDPEVNVLPVEHLGRTAGQTRCPSCKEVVVTETQSTLSETSWILCFLFSLIGCVAGCCLLPFYVKRLRNVQHLCPRCRATIHTHKPF